MSAPSQPQTRSPHFNDDVQRRLAAEDAEAWRAIAGILMTIVAAGLLGGILTVLATT